jgi:hypothetical protein
MRDRSVAVRWSGLVVGGGSATRELCGFIWAAMTDQPLRDPGSATHHDQKAVSA